jgi:hypothetical protein
VAASDYNEHNKNKCYRTCEKDKKSESFIDCEWQGFHAG